MDKTLQAELEKKRREVIALAMDTTAASDFIEADIEKAIQVMIFSQEPLLDSIIQKPAYADSVKWKKILTGPTAKAEGENAVTPGSDFTSGQGTADLKIVRSKGSVTGLAQAATQKTIDLFQEDLTLRTAAMREAIIGYTLFGNKTADPYQYDGLDTLVQTVRSNVAADVETDHLDELIDSIPAKWRSKMVFNMSSKMLSAVSKLDTDVRKNITEIEYMGGRRMSKYRGIPINESDYCRPTSTMATLASVSGVAAGGVLVPGSTYRYRMAAVTQYGEQWASPEKSQVVGGGHNSITITFTAVAGAILYKVYRTAENGLAGTEKLHAVIAANTYDCDGTITGVVTSFVDKVNVLSGTDICLDATDVDETIQLVNLDSNVGIAMYGMRNQAGQDIKTMVQYLPLARTKDSEDYLLLSYHVAAIYNEQLHGIARRVRVG
jgi:hypothetical protein